MDTLLNQLPNGGAVVAIIVITWVFLRHQEQQELRQEAIVKVFLDEVRQARKEYLDRINQPGPRK